MDTMKCWDCALKHLAAALSYGKEVMTGHSKGAELDHRPDLIGELVNCEHHAELLDRGLFHMVSELRKQLQARKGFITPEDLDLIRGLYLKTESLSEGNTGQPASKPVTEEFRSPEYPRYPAMLDVVFGKVDNPDFFRLAYESILRNLSNYGKLYVLETTLDLSEFQGVEVVGKTLNEFVKQPELSEDFLLWQQNMALLKPFDAQRSFAAYSARTTPEMLESVKFLSGQGSKGTIYLWDHCKPQPVNKAEYCELMDGISTNYPLTTYFSLKNEPKRFNTRDVTAFVERPVCCSTKQQLHTCIFACWQYAGFASLVSFLQHR